MPSCECGCGRITLGGKFVPGHDQKLRARLEADVGGILNLREMVDISKSYANGETTLQRFGHTVNKIMQHMSISLVSG